MSFVNHVHSIRIMSLFYLNGTVAVRSLIRRHWTVQMSGLYDESQDRLRSDAQARYFVTLQILITVVISHKVNFGVFFFFFFWSLQCG